jgi:hypothetical protein
VNAQEFHQRIAELLARKRREEVEAEQPPKASGTPKAKRSPPAPETPAVKKPPASQHPTIILKLRRSK